MLKPKDQYQQNLLEFDSIRRRGRNPGQQPLTSWDLKRKVQLKAEILAYRQHKRETLSRVLGRIAGAVSNVTHRREKALRN